MVDIKKNPPWFRTAKKCPYSGLAVSHPDIFVSIHPASNYFVDVAKLGDRILLVKASGYVRSHEMTDALNFMDEYVATYFDLNVGVFLIEDYEDVEGADFEARKKYINHHRDRGVFWGGILYNLPVLFRISFKIAKRLHVHGKFLYAVNSFEEAVFLATKLILVHDSELAVASDEKYGFLIADEKSSRSTLRRISEKVRKLKNKLALWLNKDSTGYYARMLLEYIESIDWYKDGMKNQAGNVFTDPDIRKVAEAISYIKSELDDLLQERTAAEKELREREARYRQLVEHAKAGILEFDYQTNRIISVNDSFLQLTGYSQEEIAAMDPMQLMTEESRKLYKERLLQIMSRNVVSPNSVYAFFARNGEKKWALLNSNISYKNGHPQKADIVITDITHLKEVENELITYQKKLRHLSAQLSKSEESQRRQLASQLHESVSQELFVAQLKLNVLEKSLRARGVAAQTEEIREQIVKSIREIKAITHDLSPPVLYELGLKEAVMALVKSAEKKFPLTVKARFSGDVDSLEDEVKFTAYRVIKEIIQNAIKHSKADFIHIIIEKKDVHLNVNITDNGIGFDVSTLSGGYYTDDGFGLFDVREKISHLDGDVTIHSTPGSGTRVSLRVPVGDTAFKSSPALPQKQSALSH